MDNFGYEGHTTIPGTHGSIIILSLPKMYLCFFVLFVCPTVYLTEFDNTGDYLCTKLYQYKG